MPRAHALTSLRAVAVLFILALFPAEFAAPGALRTLSLTQAWSWDSHVFFWGPDAAMWSLSCEAAFYAAFPFVTAIVRRHPVAAVLAASAWVLAYVVAVGDLAGHASRLTGAYYVSPLACVPEFIVGMAAAEAASALRRPRMPTWAWTSVEVGALAGLVGLKAAFGKLSRAPERPRCAQSGHSWSGVELRSSVVLRLSSCHTDRAWIKSPGT